MTILLLDVRTSPPSHPIPARCPTHLLSAWRVGNGHGGHNRGGGGMIVRSANSFQDGRRVTRRRRGLAQAQAQVLRRKSIAHGAPPTSPLSISHQRCHMGVRTWRPRPRTSAACRTPVPFYPVSPRRDCAPRLKTPAPLASAEAGCRAGHWPLPAGVRWWLAAAAASL